MDGSFPYKKGPSIRFCHLGFRIMNLRVRFQSLSVSVLIAIVFVGFPSICFAQKPLAWKFPKDRVIDVVMEQDTKMKLTGLASTPIKEINTIQRTDLIWTVLEVRSDGVVTLQQAIRRIVLEMKSQNANFVVDTDNDKPLAGVGEIMAKEIRSLAGSRFLVTTNKNGEVLDVKIPDDSSKRANPDGLAEAGLREIAVNSSLQFPNKLVNVGDTWQKQFELDMRTFGKLTVSTTYQYLGEELVAGQTLDKIRATTAMRASDPKDNSGLKLSQQESAGTIWFNNAQGCIDHCEYKQEMSMDVQQAGQQIKQIVNQDLKLKFTLRP